MRKNSRNSFGADVSRICATFLVRLKAASKYKEASKASINEERYKGNGPGTFAYCMMLKQCHRPTGRIVFGLACVGVRMLFD